MKISYRAITPFFVLVLLLIVFTGTANAITQSKFYYSFKELPEFIAIDADDNGLYDYYLITDSHWVASVHCFGGVACGDETPELEAYVYEWKLNPDLSKEIIYDKPIMTFYGDNHKIEFDLPIKNLPYRTVVVMRFSNWDPNEPQIHGRSYTFYTQKPDPAPAPHIWEYYDWDAKETKVGMQMDDIGDLSVFNNLFVNGASAWGDAPFVLGQTLRNRGMVISNMHPNYPKNIYFGWNTGPVQEFAEIFALQEGIAWKNLVLNPHGGNLGVGTKNPRFLIDTAGGAYCNGSAWVNASSRELKQDIRSLSSAEAFAVLKRLVPKEYAYKADPSEKTLGFIAEDVPDLVATNDRKSINTMDIVAVLTKVVQDQQKAIERQQREIEKLKGLLKK